MYRLPKHRLRPANTLDVRRMNIGISPAVHEYGKLDQHNFQASGFSGNVGVGAGAYNKNTYGSRAVDPDVGDYTGGYQLPTAASPGVIQLRNATAWQIVDNADVSVSTGVSWLWINTIVQYIWMPFSAAGDWGHLTHSYAGALGGNPQSAFGANIQFAIRVDGEIIYGAMTGHRSARHRERYALKATPERNFPTSTSPPIAGPGPQQTKSHHAVGCGPEAMPVRIFGCVPVTPGGHTVELIARRAPKGFDQEIPWYDSLSDFVALFSRKMLVTEFPTWPAATVASASLQVAAFGDNDLLSAATLGTDRMAALATRYNTVQEGAVARGGLGREHLPGLLLAYGAAHIDNIPYAGRATDARYPGWSATTEFANVILGDDGWWVLDNNGGADMRAAHAGGGNFDSDVASLILVLANVNVRQITRAGSELEPALFAQLAIGANRVVSNNAVIKDTQVIVNNWNVLNRDQTDAAIAGYVDYDVALMAVLDNRQLVYAGDDWQDFFVTISGFRPDVADRVTVTWRNANITVLQMRAG